MVFLVSLVLGVTPGAGLSAHAMVSNGSNARIWHVFARAEAGKPLVIGAIGGSITQGAGASDPEHRWVNRVFDWWQSKFPNTPVQLVNAGIGATGSDIGSYRVQRDLLVRQPDFVAVEFAVNDPSQADPLLLAMFEGMLRQILASPKKPAVVLLFTMDRNGNNAQGWQSAIGRHYRLAMVSYRDAIWPQIEASKMKLDDVFYDIIHPNDRGHRYCADFINNFLAAELEKYRAALKAPHFHLPPIQPMPKPLYSKEFFHTAILTADHVTPSRADGWQVTGQEVLGKGWWCDQVGGVLEIPVRGTTIGLMLRRVHGSLARAEASVDGSKPVLLDSSMVPTWGAYAAYETVVTGLKPGKHVLTVTLINTPGATIDSNRFEVWAIGEAGIGNSK